MCWHRKMSKLVVVIIISISWIFIPFKTKQCTMDPPPTIRRVLTAEDTNLPVSSYFHEHLICITSGLSNKMTRKIYPQEIMEQIIENIWFLKLKCYNLDFRTNEYFDHGLNKANYWVLSKVILIWQHYVALNFRKLSSFS